MKKKIVKPLVIAASVAAIAGIGAVSFAAWGGGTSNKTVTGGNTGHVDTTGFGSGSTTTLSKKLMPHDQPSIESDETKMYDILLVVEGNDVANYEIKGKYTAKNGESDYAWATGSSLKYLIDKNPTATYADSWTTWTPNEANSAAMVGGDTLTKDSWYVHVALVSGEAADMDITLEFSFELAGKTTEP